MIEQAFCELKYLANKIDKIYFFDDSQKRLKAELLYNLSLIIKLYESGELITSENIKDIKLNLLKSTEINKTYQLRIDRHTKEVELFKDINKQLKNRICSLEELISLLRIKVEQKIRKYSSKKQIYKKTTKQLEIENMLLTHQLEAYKNSDRITIQEQNDKLKKLTPRRSHLFDW